MSERRDGFRRGGAPLALKPQVYLDERPAERFERYHARARRRGPDWVYDLVRLLVTPFCTIVFRMRALQTRNVPGAGAVILAPNHFSAMDHFFCGMFLRRRVQFMAKSQLFRGVLAWILRNGAAFPVRRGKHDEEAMVTALQILARGGVIVIYPEGGRSRTQQVGRQARRGVGRLALESGAPVIPVAIHGSLRARNWKRLEFPKVTVRYGEPLAYPTVEASDAEQQQAVAQEVLGSVRALYDELNGSRERSAAPAVPAPPPAAH
ncbi:MAG: 1-acyl-sn-glycerol-3-phosphate acyltransferase [Solirubrobacterales bacterium]|nr:1-acyl-sn-glycerol-3-phosphate acyltransferase [Solirubrobacterales bacterium]